MSWRLALGSMVVVAVCLLAVGVVQFVERPVQGGPTSSRSTTSLLGAELTSDQPSVTSSATDDARDPTTTSEPLVSGSDVLEAALALAAQNERKVPGTEPSPVLGCERSCTVVGFQDLTNQSRVTLENLIVTNPGGRCLDLTGSSDITIRNVTIIGCGTEQAVNEGYSAGMITIADAQNITIENSIIRDISNEQFGASRNNAIEINDSSNISIRSSLIADVHSDIEQNADDKGSRSIVVTGSSWNITIYGNRFHNAGRNAVQLSRVREATGILIESNLIDGRARWDSDYEDMINLFSSSGTPDEPIRVTGNTLRNGGPSRSGTGIILGDGTTESGPTEYVIAEDNVLINPGHVGINLAGGNNIMIVGNLIVGVGSVPHPTTVGMAINDYGYSAECRDHNVIDNRVWMDNQHVEGGINHLWNPLTCQDNVQLSDNRFGE